jgi:hypothetical protein
MWIRFMEIARVTLRQGTRNHKQPIPQKQSQKCHGTCTLVSEKRLECQKEKNRLLLLWKGDPGVIKSIPRRCLFLPYRLYVTEKGEENGCMSATGSYFQNSAAAASPSRTYACAVSLFSMLCT